ncbi:MAG: FAD-dependent dehydrogenase [Phycisphaerales bacterium]|nr:FAD-dependent dehydrogenase [Phycisphaerales bacterium]MDB5356598.1 FAD-dependent dehydrogenase [Phycisphaerales bacterium]
MKRALASIMLLAAGVVWSTGCNAVYFYETEKVALGIEARPNDPSNPVNGHLAIQQRVAAIIPTTDDGTGSNTPPDHQQAAAFEELKAKVDALTAAQTKVATAAKNPDELKTASAKLTKAQDELRKATLAFEQSHDAAGDALSVASAFRFKKYRIQSPDIWPRVTIDSALITGEPARIAAGNQTITKAIGALSGSALSKPSTHRLSILALTFDKLVELSAGGDTRARAMVDRLDGAARNLPANYPATFYFKIAEDAKKVTLNVMADKGTPLPPPKPNEHDFEMVIAYNKIVQGSLDGLPSARAAYQAGKTLVITSLDGKTTDTYQQNPGDEHRAAVVFDESIQDATAAQQSLDKLIDDSGILDAVAAIIGKSH